MGRIHRIRQHRIVDPIFGEGDKQVNTVSNDETEIEVWILKYVSHNLNERSAMKSLTLNGLLVTKCGLMSKGWTSSTFPFSDSLAELCLSARSRYQEKLKRQKEEEELKEMEDKKRADAARKTADKAALEDIKYLKEQARDQQSKAETKRKQAMALLASAEKEEAAARKIMDKVFQKRPQVDADYSQPSKHRKK